jgi:hypothetical protein
MSLASLPGSLVKLVAGTGETVQRAILQAKKAHFATQLPI